MQPAKMSYSTTTTSMWVYELVSEYAHVGGVTHIWAGSGRGMRRLNFSYPTRNIFHPHLKLLPSRSSFTQPPNFLSKPLHMAAKIILVEIYTDQHNLRIKEPHWKTSLLHFRHPWKKKREREKTVPQKFWGYETSQFIAIQHYDTKWQTKKKQITLSGHKLGWQEWVKLDKFIMS